MKRALFIAVLLAGCGSFEDPAIVIDFRVLAMTASPPEQLIPIDPNNPPDPATIKLAPIDLCALVADPDFDRALEFEMQACPGDGDGRCDPTEPSVLVGGGMIDDPEAAPTPQPACARLEPSAGLLAVLRQAAIDDPLAGFGQIDVQIVMRVNAPGARPEDALWATKAIRFGALIPADRRPNHNPTLSSIDWTRADQSTGALALGRCADQLAPLEVRAGEAVKLLPVEPEGAREDYVVPKFDGTSEMLHENLSYQWLASGGKWRSSSTGGPKDGFGNEPDLFTTWTAPAAADVGDGADVSLWVVQRDERLGAAWYESCVHVVP